jgi:hypothetical protein
MERVGHGARSATMGSCGSARSRSQGLAIIAMVIGMLDETKSLHPG